MISHRHRCIYVKIPKCASSAVLEWFTAHGGGRHSFRPYWYGGLLSARIQGVAHAMNLYPDYRTFSFVRNPYARFVSIYLYLRRMAEIGAADAPADPADYGSLREFAELCCAVLDDLGPRWGREAERFFRANAHRKYGSRGIGLARLGFVTGHARPQTDFLPDRHPERLFGVRRANPDPLSFVGRVETMDADFARLGELLGLPAEALPRRSRSCGGGAGEGRAWAAFYDAETRRLVERLYAADLEFTGCGFDDGAARVPVTAPVRPPRPARSRPRALLARAWFELKARETGLEDRLRRYPAVRRLLHPIGRLRQAAWRWGGSRREDRLRRV